MSYFFYYMFKKFLLTGLVMAAVCCLLSCNGGQDKQTLSQVQFENYRSIKEVAEGKSLDRTKFVLPKDDASFGKKLYSEKTICFTDVTSDVFGARTCTADIYENGVSIEVDGHKSYFDAAGMDMMPKEGEFTMTAMPSDIPGAPWQPAIVMLENETSYWVYTSLYNKRDFAHRKTQRIEGWYWEYAKKQGYKYNVLLLN